MMRCGRIVRITTYVLQYSVEFPVVQQLDNLSLKNELAHNSLQVGASNPALKAVFTSASLNMA
jgi:hypothetical protein